MQIIFLSYGGISIGLEAISPQYSKVVIDPNQTTIEE
jgi:hypothetical protein